MKEYSRESYETLLRIESLLKNLLQVLYQERKKDMEQIKRQLIFDKNKLIDFKSERDKLRETYSFKCYWNNIKRTWIFEGSKKVLEVLLNASQEKGIRIQAIEVN